MGDYVVLYPKGVKQAGEHQRGAGPVKERFLKSIYFTDRHQKKRKGNPLYKITVLANYLQKGRGARAPEGGVLLHSLPAYPGGEEHHEESEDAGIKTGDYKGHRRGPLLV